MLERPRWSYRFENFRRANARLREIVALARSRETSEIEDEATVSRFVTTWELGWKLLKDLLEYDGVPLPTTTPRAVIRAAREAGFITDAAPWFAAMDARNLMAHTYDETTFREIVGTIRENHAPLFEALETFCRSRIDAA